MSVTDRMLKTLKPRPQIQAPIATDMFIPNKSGDIKNPQNNASFNNLQITNNPINGYVFTSDANGNGTWQPSPTQFGDLPGGNYSEFEPDGTLVMHGDATVWKTVEAKLQEWKDDTNFPPAWINGGFAGTNEIGYNVFDKDPEKNAMVHFCLPLPTDYKENTPIWFFVNYTVPHDFVIEEKLTMTWELIYSWSNEGQYFTNQTGALEMSKEISTGNYPAWLDLQTDVRDGGMIEPITDQSGLIRSKLMCRLKRGKHDSYLVDYSLLSVGFWYEADTLGARNLQEK